MKALIQKVVGAFGPSGREDAIRDVIKKEMKGLVDEIREDAMGNLICIKKGSGARVMVAGHMDEIGIVTTHVSKEGFLSFTSVGGVSPIRCLYKRVVFENGVRGVIAMEPVKNANEIDFTKLFVDIGARDKSDAEKMLGVGKFGAFSSDFEVFNDLYASKAMDDRLGCAVMIEAASRLKKTPNEIAFIFTVQEEVGLRGAKAAAYSYEPDFGIAIDVTGSGDTPEAPKMSMALRNGVAIKISDSSLLVPKKVKEFFVKLAEKNKIKYQMEILTAGGTDGGAINLTKAGILAGVLSIPTRYVHSITEVVSKDDVENTVALLVKALETDIKKELLGK